MISSKPHSQQQVAAAACAYGGKTARACDSCIRKRARWYCAADDAFLCQSCDSSVHSANPLARRHERVRLKTASSENNTTVDDGGGGASPLVQQPAWHRGFTRKARTPRTNGAKTTSSPFKPNNNGNPFEKTPRMRVPLVPEFGSDDHDEEAAAAAEEEHQLLYRVPVFDPLELCNSNESFHHHQAAVLPSDMDLAEFAADVESLLGRGMEDESFGMEELGILDCGNAHKEDDDDDVSKLVKMETSEFVDEYHNRHDDGGVEEAAVMMKCGGGGGVDDDSDEPLFQLSFEYGDYSPEEDEKLMVMRLTGAEEEGEHDVDIIGGGTDELVGDNMEIVGEKRKRNILLRLNYEAVMAAWDSTTRGCTSPWTDGRRPEFHVNQCWPDCMGGCGREYLHHHHQRQLGYQQGEGRSLGGGHMSAAAGDGGREARVSRYREKRRTRLFSKKIRYEVRKLNAEKRPRMKGRFVKRASFAAADY